MKIKILLLLILSGALAFTLNAQTAENKQQPCKDCGTVKDSVLVRLNTGEEVLVVKKGTQQFDISQSNMAKQRKQLGCPDIFAPPPPPEKTPAIEEPAPPKIEIAPVIEPPKAKPFFLPDPVFFRINKWVIDAPEWSKIELAVDFLRSNPNATVVVTGYADKKTGNATINQRLSKLRSEAVSDTLEKKYGIAKYRISVNWKGDGLQPFEFDNDKNRAVLFLINP